MKTNGFKFRELTLKPLLVLILLLASLQTAPAEPVSAERAKAAVRGWLKRDQRPLGATLGQRVKEVQTFKDDKGQPLYHVVYLDPSGFVIVPADDLVEPIVAFASRGRFDPSLNSPLGALVTGDVPGRVAHVRDLRTRVPASALLQARSKWQTLQKTSIGGANPISIGARHASPRYGIISSESDIRVAPLVHTLWGQGTSYNGLACFNYYTPPYPAATSSNYPSSGIFM
jgi:hypothetical protein